MKAFDVLRTTVRSVVLSASVGIGAAALFAASAVASPVADSCSLINQAALAKTFGHANAVTHKTLLRAPGNTAGVIQDRCTAHIWDGRNPGIQPKRQRLEDGSVSVLRIDAWVPDEGPFADSWRGNFGGQIKALTSGARRQFVHGASGGSPISIPKFGAEHSLAFIATVGKLERVRAFWWSADFSSIVSMNATEAKTQPIVRSLGQVAKWVVPAIR